MLSKEVSALGPKDFFFFLVDDNDLVLYSKNFVSVSAELSGRKGLAFLLTENDSNRKTKGYA